MSNWVIKGKIWVTKVIKGKRGQKERKGGKEASVLYVSKGGSLGIYREAKGGGGWRFGTKTEAKGRKRKVWALLVISRIYKIMPFHENSRNKGQI